MWRQLASAREKYRHRGPLAWLRLKITPLTRPAALRFKYDFPAAKELMLHRQAPLAIL